MESAVRRTLALYGVNDWGRGYFDIGRNGHLLVTPTPGTSIDLHRVREEAAAQGLRLPLQIRFPEILHEQVRKLHDAFAASRRNFPFEGAYRAAFPLKVNNRRPVVEEILRAGGGHGMGIEVGSKPELLIASGLDLPEDAFLVCNGFKDVDYARIAAYVAGSGLRVFLVIERLRELDTLGSLGDERRNLEIGLRGRLYSRGSGKWQATGGDTGKFGLGPEEILHALNRIQDLGMKDRVTMLHFHLGSQIPEIRRIKAAVREATRIYAKVKKMGFPVSWLNVGGGLGVDYDGSGSSGDSSVNYTVEEYANDVVYNTREISEHESVPHPGVISESGRFLTAHHALLLVEAEERAKAAPPPAATGGDEHPLMAELEESARVINAKNYREYYHDAVLEREELQSLFELGYLSLEARARAEAVFRETAARALAFARADGELTPEFEAVAKAFRVGYVANFSVFRSLADAWSIKQLFPVLPVHRLDEDPTERGVLLDLTCDSDGRLDRFVDPQRVKEGLELHATRPGEPYVLAVCLVGAYQDVMGNSHNLLAPPRDVSVLSKGADGFRIAVEDPAEPFGRSAEGTLRDTGWDPAAVRERLIRRLMEAGTAGRAPRLTPQRARELAAAASEIPYMNRDSS